MITAFEQSVQRHPQSVCFTYIDEQGIHKQYSYVETRLMAAAVAQVLSKKGVGARSLVAVDLPNCPALIFLLLAAGFGGFTLVVMNNRQTSTEKAMRLSQLGRYSSETVAYRVDTSNLSELLNEAQALRESSPSTCIHIAERRAHLFDKKLQAVIMFTSGSSGVAKPAPLTWDNLCSASRASNSVFCQIRQGLWQIALPLYHVGGLQMVVRSILNGTSFVLYRCFNPQRILQDARVFRATHISVVDKMLQDLLDSSESGSLSQYQCVLLGGASPNPKTLHRAAAAGINLFVSYGMTETSSHIAYARAGESYHGGLRLLDGYSVHIVDPQEDGFGRLAVQGPGVFNGYANSQTAHTIDGYFLTGDTAAFQNDLLYLKERTADMFVSGGENVYPAEIRSALLRQPGVAEAYVFSTPDPRWGRRPVAFVEKDANSHATRLNAHQFAAQLRGRLATQLAKMYVPKNICVLEKLPRMGVGKVDCGAMQQAFDERIEVKSITLHRIKLPFKEPFRTPQATLFKRESIIVEITDHAGRTGIGECVAFATDWYLPETLREDARILRDILAPAVLHSTFLHPREASELFTCTDAIDYPLACGALEPALWDLYGKIVKKPLWKLLQEENDRLEKEAQDFSDQIGIERIKPPSIASRWWRKAPEIGPNAVQANAGAVIGCGSLEETLTAAKACAESGYKRIKLKVTPATCSHVKAVREELPYAMMSVDANQSFSESDLSSLKELDSCRLGWIEEPLRLKSEAGTKKFEQLESLQKKMNTLLCLDESIVSEKDMVAALEQPSLNCYALKIAKLGGVMPALRFLQHARSRGMIVWMGGMYDTGVSKRVHAAFQTLPGVTSPGDIGATNRYFTHDITMPAYEAQQGSITLNAPDSPYGLGCELNGNTMKEVSEGTLVIE